MRVLIVLGAPGSGKGTQSRLLAERLGMQQVTTGDLLREHVRNQTGIGIKAKSYMDRGDLVPDEIVIRMIQQMMDQTDREAGIVLDGFPRTLKQAEALGRALEGMPVSRVKVVKIDVSEEELMKRLSGRRTCRQCGAQYHLFFQPSEEPGRCDRCGGQIYQRDDDREDTVQARLSVYRRETLPLDGYYERLGLLVRVDGLGAVDEIYRCVRSAVGDHEA